jgi:hypothetical protein
MPKVYRIQKASHRGHREEEGDRITGWEGSTGREFDRITGFAGSTGFLFSDPVDLSSIPFIRLKFFFVVPLLCAPVVLILPCQASDPPQRHGVHRERGWSFDAHRRNIVNAEDGWLKGGAPVRFCCHTKSQTRRSTLKRGKSQLEFLSIDPTSSVLDHILTEGARRLFQAARKSEILEHLGCHERMRDADGHREVVRNGHLRMWVILAPAGPSPNSNVGLTTAH